MSGYDDCKRGALVCEVCGEPSAGAGGSPTWCARHWPEHPYPGRPDLDGYYVPMYINQYQASALLDCLARRPELSTGDWHGEWQILLRNIGVLRPAEQRAVWEGGA